ncbi:alkaline phosphatase family protein [Methanocella conradii]|uniref:alkaline phosphatase family protein n=1 Tax=Methanocella conradii TaxID=1175444 RepID=UPI0024B36735|nr:alkaline phosphatase family protein [Methanocella conradii]MDI6897187.1 alkaline phosphatase family protein [Methanocella conradii]
MALPKKPVAFLILLAVVLLVVAISFFVFDGSSWSFTINGDTSKSVNSSLYAKLENCTRTYDGVTGIPLEFFLYYYGVYPVESVSYGGATLNWSAAAYSADKDIPLLVGPDGAIHYKGATAVVKNVEVAVSEKPSASTLDIAPSILYALNEGGREGLIHGKAGRVVLIYIDALGYYRYEDALSRGLVDNMSSLGEPIKAICVYPSITQNNAKSMATGLAPNLSKGDFRSYEPAGKTIVDVLNENGKSAVWVDGPSPPVNISATVSRVDSNGDGTPDDEVADAAIWECRTGANLTIVHFKSTDTVMHAYGPYSEEGRGSLKAIDSYVGKILKALDNGTVVVICSDHGCHAIENGGNHGTLLPDDMYIPIIVGSV